MFETDVIIDDFGANSIDLNHLLRWFDRYKCLVEYKGGMVALHAVNFIITSNFQPEDLFKEETYNEDGRKRSATHAQYPALQRRLRICNFGGKYPNEYISCGKESIYRSTPEQFKISYHAIKNQLLPPALLEDEDVNSGRMSRERSPSRFQEGSPAHSSAGCPALFVKDESHSTRGSPMSAQSCKSGAQEDQDSAV